MSAVDELGGDDPVEVYAGAEAAAPEPMYEPTSVARIAALSAALATRGDALGGLEDELAELGVPPALRTGDIPWPLDDRELFAEPPSTAEENETEERIGLWREIEESARLPAIGAFLVRVLGSRLEAESAAAAAALWRNTWWWPRPWPRTEFVELPLAGVDEDQSARAWDGDAWGALCRDVMRSGDPADVAERARFLAYRRVLLGLSSESALTRSLASAALLPRDDSDAGSGARPPERRPEQAELVSTMIHGTWAWIGDWWRPGGDFHSFVLRDYRGDLYRGGAKFSWSGAYRQKHRTRASDDLREWAGEMAPAGFHSVFAHSYGGDVAARAFCQGVPMQELVLLSAPVSAPVAAAARSGLRIVDVRVRFDVVLAMTGWPQRIRDSADTTTVLLGWRLGHAASHREHVWRDENVAAQGGL